MSRIIMVVYQGNQRDPSELHDTVQVVSLGSFTVGIFGPFFTHF